MKAIRPVTSSWIFLPELPLKTELADRQKFRVAQRKVNRYFDRKKRFLAALSAPACVNRAVN